ncbi:dihydroxy-acid dehydratase [Desmospora sp. 8437]|nr:dihydroxy-acid dehydratase [Desmospora sp. 8437]
MHSREFSVQTIPCEETRVQGEWALCARVAFCGMEKNKPGHQEKGGSGFVSVQLSTGSFSSRTLSGSAWSRP